MEAADHGDRRLLSGNEAIALAAKHAGVALGAGYPGTPSTEILENFAKLGGHAQWSPNEKVALEVCIGAAYGGARALATMKHVGVNVAADPLFTASYTGVCGGLVLVTADDPEMHSSQNEQDNRNYAFAAKVPMFEPAAAAGLQVCRVAGLPVAPPPRGVRVAGVCWTQPSAVCSCAQSSSSVDGENGSCRKPPSLGAKAVSPATLARTLGGVASRHARLSASPSATGVHHR
jgi:hypothetical protein